MIPYKKLSREDLNSLAKNVSRLSALLTKERDALPAEYLKDAGLRRAYIEYFLPSNIYKIHIPLRELIIHPQKIFAKDRLKVLDIGCGPGTAVLGVLDFFSSQEEMPFLEFTAVDHVQENLAAAEALFKERGCKRATIRTAMSGIEDIEGVVKGKFDVIILSNLLNEVARDHPERIEKRVDILNGLLSRHLASDGSCIIIEPSLRETSREMLMVRDGLVRDGLHIYSPCLYKSDCPALANPKDWCHEDIPWEFTDEIKEIDRLTGLRKDSLKFSYLVVRKDSLSISDIFDKGAMRVVSEPLPSKGKLEFFLCGEMGRVLAARLDRDETPVNEAFSDLKRGYVAAFKGMDCSSGRCRVGKECIVEILNRN